MTEVFVVRNQQGHYWGKSKAWVDGSEARAVARVKHRDEAVNLLFELSAKDTELRGEILAAQLSARGDPQVEPSQVPLPGLEEEVPSPEPLPEQQPEQPPEQQPDACDQQGPDSAASRE